ncbi:amidase [Pseudalkalibacillus hwajinpoensis]|uniref:Amidase n=1 Tax=Guptibacillus hwajinpoensis TaxID=208199 RepID=A0A4U1MDT1_9BACL|nr:amidase [Pseudalkalibacillus hwajinpoensis]TKD68296.1 amidase [Pseudalkalibacillus hwajinpoensis]
MKNVTVAVGILFFVLVFFMESIILPEGKVEAVEVDRSLATWLWDTKQIETQPYEVLQFLEEKQVTDVYLQINRSIANPSYHTFIENASMKGINVHALDGAPNWATSKGEIYQDRLFTWLKDYQMNATLAQQFKGVHLDIEPYHHSGWTNNYQRTVAFYQDRLSNGKERADNLRLSFGVDTPFWFDEQSYNNRYGIGNLSEWVIQKADVTTLMAYRDRADGGNGIIALVGREMTFAEQIGKRVSIAVETGQISEVPYLSFYEEGSAIMDQELLKVSATYGTSPAMNGYAIHYIDSWMTLKP